VGRLSDPGVLAMTQTVTCASCTRTIVIPDNKPLPTGTIICDDCLKDDDD
jgi:hypothetical protein